MAPHWLIVRGALSFGVALAMLPHAMAVAPIDIGAVFVLAFLAGVAFTYGTGMPPRVPFAFGVGSLVAFAIIWFSLISLQGGGRPDFLWLFIASFVAWSIAGAIGGAAIRFSMVILGMAAFGIGGAIAGSVWAYALAPNTIVTEAWVLSIGWGFGGTVAGGLFGAAVAFSSRRA